MRNLPKSLPISSYFQHSSITHKPFSSIDVYNQPTLQNDSKNANSQVPISQNHQSFNLFSQSLVVNNLLKFKNDPFSALVYYESIERQPGFSDNLDYLCILIHILMGFNVDRQILIKLVANEQFPNVKTLISCLVEKSGNFGFALDFKVFNYLLCCYTVAGRVNDAIFCVNWMLENDFVVRVLHINFLFDDLVKNNMNKIALEVYNALCNGGIFGDGETVRVMMRACLREGSPWKAEAVFRKAREMGVELGVGVYSCAVGVVRRKGDANMACELFREMKEKGWVPSQGTFTEGIIACVKGRNMVEALRLKDEMILCGKPMNLVVATTLMKGYCAAGDLESALSLFGRMSEDGLSPNKVTFAVLIYGCSSKSKMQKAFELYDEMIRIGIEPSVYHVNSLIIGFLNGNSLDKAYEQFNKGIESGLVDVSSYNILISWLCRNNKVHEAQQLWDKMVKCGIKPTLVLYNHLILGYSREGNVVMVDRIHAEMWTKGFKPNAITFTILIDGYFKKSEVENALGLYDEMVSNKVACTPHTYNTIISGLCKVGQTSRAREKLKIFINARYFNPSVMTYNSLIDGLVREGDMDSALSVFSRLNEIELSPNVVTYTILIDGYCKSNNVDRALKIQNEMKVKGLELDVTTYGALIDGFCKRMDMESACRLLYELLESGPSPTIVIYNSIISGYRDVRNMAAALSVHETMIEQGISCDVETYTTLIDGLLRVGDLKTASDFFTEMLAKEIQPDVVTYTVLVNGLCNKGQLENARELFDEMEEKGLRRNSLMFNALIAGYFRVGNLPEAFKLYEEMLDRGFSPDKMTFDLLTNGNKTHKDTADAAFA